MLKGAGGASGLLKGAGVLAAAGVHCLLLVVSQHWHRHD